MRSSFLIGTFLPGHASVFTYKRPKGNLPSLDPDFLAERFANRSTKYTGKQTRYAFGLQAGLALSLAALLGAFSIPYTPESEFVVEEVRQELVEIEEIQQTQQEFKPPPPPRPTLPIAVPDDELIEDIELDLDVSLELDEEITNIDPPPAQGGDGEEEESEPEIFMVVENPPEIVGGLAALSAALEYPRTARQAGVEGNVIVQVLIDENGNPSDAKILRSASPLLEQPAIDAVLAQTFKPGRQRGRAVKTYISIPVRFRLTD